VANALTAIANITCAASLHFDKLSYELNCVAFLLVSLSTGLKDATIVGYLKCFHADLSEPWGLGITIA